MTKKEYSKLQTLDTYSKGKTLKDIKNQGGEIIYKDSIILFKKSYGGLIIKSNNIYIRCVNYKEIDII